MHVHMYMNAKHTGMFACIYVHVYMFTCHIQLMIKNEKDILKCNTIKQF